MNEIIFATGNKGKVATLENHLKSCGLNIRVVQQPLELIEPQAATAAEVARVKAKQAFAQLQKPVLVDDSSFHIYALGGFPGPYIKYMLETVGAGGIVRFMEGKTDRRAYATSTLAFVDGTGELHEFSRRESDGVIATEVRESVNEGWGDLWKIYMPAGSDKTLSQMTPEDFLARKQEQNDPSAYTQFCEWLKTRGPNPELLKRRA